MASLSDAKRLVVKVGSALLVDGESGTLRDHWLASLAADIAALRKRGTDVVVVSSGSIALGRGVLELGGGALALDQSQAAASVGQIRLARAWEAALAPHAITTGQILVTLEDSTDRRRYLNTRATMMQLLGLGVTPIVNENDTIATDEIRYGDNDRLAAQVAVTVGADCLVLLSDVDGFYDANPHLSDHAQRFDRIDKITPEIEALAGDAGTGLSKGGMKTKLMAARIATDAGCAMAIASGTINNPLKSLENSGPATWFTAQHDPQHARKRWIAAMKPRGGVIVDAGAVKALADGKSLLPAGVRGVDGSFERGDPITIHGPDGVLGVGLTGYTATEAAAIAGKRSDALQETLGYKGRATLIHRDDMVLQS